MSKLSMATIQAKIKTVIGWFRGVLKRMLDKVYAWANNHNANSMSTDYDTDVVETITTSKGSTINWEDFLEMIPDKSKPFNEPSKDATSDPVVRSKVVTFKSGNKINITVNSAVIEVPYHESNSVTKIQWMCIAQHGDNISVMTQVKHLFGGVTIYTRNQVKEMSILEVSNVHGLNPYIFVDRQPKRNVDIYKADYTGKDACLYLKVPDSATDHMIVTKVYSEVKIYKRKLRSHRSETIAILLVVPLITNAIYLGCVTQVSSLPFIVTHTFKHINAGYVGCLCSAISMHNYEFELKYAQYD